MVRVVRDLDTRRALWSRARLLLRAAAAHTVSWEDAMAAGIAYAHACGGSLAWTPTLRDRERGTPAWRAWRFLRDAREDGFYKVASDATTGPH